MNLTVRKRHCFASLTLQVRETHGDHSSLFFIDVDKLDQALLAACFKVPLTTATARGRFHQSFVKDHLDVPLAYPQLIVIDNVEGSLHTARV